MIKWPEPLLTVDEKLSSIIPAGTRLHTEQSLKKAVRDAYEDAAKTCDRLRREQIRYFNGMGSAGCPEYGPSDCADAIRALIKEI